MDGTAHWALLTGPSAVTCACQFCELVPRGLRFLLAAGCGLCRAADMLPLLTAEGRGAVSDGCDERPDCLDSLATSGRGQSSFGGKTVGFVPLRSLIPLGKRL